jgi:hypothetical protein
MNITHVKWNTDKPKFEDVEGKIVIVEWAHIAKEMDSFKFYDIGSFERVNWKNVKCCAVLSDEPVYCEWTRLPDSSGITHFFCGCNKSDVLQIGKHCQFCGNPIYIVDELKPLPLMGIEPKVHTGMADDWVEIEWTATEGNSYFAHITEYYRIIRPTKREAIESWNLLVKKLTGEK